MKKKSLNKASIYLLLPLTIWLLCFAVLPLVYGVYLSFHNAFIGNLKAPDFVGLQNYILLIKDSALVRAFSWSIKFAVIAVTVEMVVGIAIAELFNRQVPMKGLFITLILIPIVVSPALMGTMFRLLFNEFVGPLAFLLGGLLGTTALLGMSWVFQTVVAADFISNTPFIFLNAYTSLQSVPEELLEAAQIDGANGWQRFWKISIPMITPILSVTFLERLLASFLVFAMVFTLTSGGPGNMTQSVSIYIYKRAFERSDFGMANAASVLVALVTLFPTLFVVRKTMKRIR